MNLTPRRFRRVCLILAIAALGLRMAGLAEKSVTIDEISTRQISSHLSRKTIGGRPPLSFILVAAALKIRNSQIMLLLPAVLFGAATVGLLGWTGRVGFGRRVGLIAGLWMLFSPLHIHYSQYARYYSFMIFFSLVSFFYLDLWLRMRRRRYLVLWLLSATLNMASHFFAAFVVALQVGVVFVALWLILLRVVLGKGRLTTAILTAVAIGIVGLMAWVALTRTGLKEMVIDQITNRPPWQTQEIDVTWAFWRPYLAAMTGWPAGWLPAALVLLAVGAVASWRRNKLFLLHLVALLIVPIVAVYVVQPRHPFETRYVSFALPFYLLGLALGLVTLWEWTVQWRRVPARFRRRVGDVLACLGLAVPVLGLATFAGEPVRRETRDIVRYVERLARPHDFILFSLRDDEQEFRYFVSLRRAQALRRLESDKAASATIQARLPFHNVEFRRHESWKPVRDFYYPKRFARPFWYVAGRLHGHKRDEMQWAINTLSHQAFEHGYVFYSTRLIEMELSGGILNQARYRGSTVGLPAMKGGIDPYRFSVYIPRSGEYYVLSNQTVRLGMARIEGMRPVRWIQLLPKPVSKQSKTYIPEGRLDFTLVFPKGEIARLKDFRLRILPAVGSQYTINASQHDLIQPYNSFDFPTTYEGEFGIRRRLWGLLSFPIVIEKTGRYEISVTADNDRPATNELGLVINKNPFHRFVFNRRDNSLETKRTEVNLRAGVWVLSVQNRWYKGVDEVRRGPVPDNRKTLFVSKISIKAVKPRKPRPP